MAAYWLQLNKFRVPVVFRVNRVCAWAGNPGETPIPAAAPAYRHPVQERCHPPASGPGREDSQAGLRSSAPEVETPSCLGHEDSFDEDCPECQANFLAPLLLDDAGSALDLFIAYLGQVHISVELASVFSRRLL